MSLKPLIQNQTLKIDDHNWGAREYKKWDLSNKDVHIDKSTKRPVNGKKQNVRIRIPINSDRPLKIENQRGNIMDDVPRSLKKEITSAFEDKTIREEFINDLVDVLKNYDSILDNLGKVSEALKKISKHFDLDWTDQNIQGHIEGYLDKYTQVYRDDKGEQFFITVDRRRITLGNVDNRTRAKLGIKKYL